MKAHPKKPNAFPSMDSVRDRVLVKPKAFDPAAERKAAASAAAEYGKWLGGLANQAIERTGQQRLKAKTLRDATQPVVFDIAGEDVGLTATAFLYAGDKGPNAAFEGALATAIEERLRKAGSQDFVQVDLDESAGVKVEVRISDRAIPKVEKPQPVSANTGDTDLGDITMKVTTHAATIEACLAAVELGVEGPLQLQRLFGIKKATADTSGKTIEKFFNGEAKVPRDVAFGLVIKALELVRDFQTIKRPTQVTNAEIQKALGALQSAARV